MLSLTSRPDLREDLAALLPRNGLELRFWEIGGKGGHLRGAPRGRAIDGLVICYDVGDRESFLSAAHLLLQHRADRHHAHERATVVSSAVTPPRLAVVLCGTRADEADKYGGHAVSSGEAVKFAHDSAMYGAFVTSSATGEGVDEVLQALAAALLEADESAHLEQMMLARQAPAGESWSLGLQGSRHGANGRVAGQMTSPRGLRPHEPPRGAIPERMVEVIDADGCAYGVRPLDAVLARGLLHRAVHVWLCDFRTGGLLLRRYSKEAPKHPGQWGPTCHGEVLSYSAGGLHGPPTSELSTDAAMRLLSEQLGLENVPGTLDHWFSCVSSDGLCCELVEVYVATLGETSSLPPLCLAQSEDAEWVHFTDISCTSLISLRWGLERPAA